METGTLLRLLACVRQEATGQRAARSAAQACLGFSDISQRSLLTGIPGFSGKASSSLFSLEDEEFFLLSSSLSLGFPCLFVSVQISLHLTFSL